MRGIVRRIVLAGGALAILGGFYEVSADTFSSTNYVINASVMNSTGGLGTSTSYKLVSSAGESVIGDGASGSYKMSAGYVAQLQQSAPQSMTLAVQPGGLVGYYPLDENTGTVAGDDSSNAAHGTLVGSPTWATGQVGSALTFNGSSQAVSVGNNSQTQLTNGTVSAWVKSTASTGTRAIVHKLNSYYLQFSAGKLALYDWTGAATCAATATSTDGNWHHVAMTLQSGVTNGSVLYVDGAAVKTCTWTPVSQTGSLVVGAAYSGSYSNYFDGTIDEVKLFNRALSADEIAAERSAGVAGFPAGVAISNIIPGSPASVNTDAIVKTVNVPNYTLTISQDHDLQNGANTIAAISGSIASPTAWSDGTTKGFGFTLMSAPGLDGKWGSGANYAAAPGSATTFYTRTGASNSVKDVVAMRLKADTTLSTPAGQYTNQLTITGTITP